DDLVTGVQTCALPIFLVAERQEEERVLDGAEPLPLELSRAPGPDALQELERRPEIRRRRLRRARARAIQCRRLPRPPSIPRSVHGAAVRYLREGPLRGSYDQPRAQAHEAPVASEPRLDTGADRRQDPARARLHPVSQGGQGHQGHLSTGTNGRGRGPLPDRRGWEATAPHRGPAALLLLFLCRFLLPRQR